MRTVLQPLAVLLLCMSALSAAAAPPGAGDVAPDAIGRDLAGEPVSLASYAGKTVVVSF